MGPESDWLEHRFVFATVLDPIWDDLRGTPERWPRAERVARALAEALRTRGPRRDNVYGEWSTCRAELDHIEVILRARRRAARRLAIRVGLLMAPAWSRLAALAAVSVTWVAKPVTWLLALLTMLVAVPQAIDAASIESPKQSMLSAAGRRHTERLVTFLADHTGPESAAQPERRIDFPDGVVPIEVRPPSPAPLPRRAGGAKPKPSVAGQTVQDRVVPVSDHLDITFVGLPSGTFQRGSPYDEEGRRPEERQHRVRLPSFAVQRDEATVAQFTAVMGLPHSPLPWATGSADSPQGGVSWHAGVAFCERLHAQVYGAPSGCVRCTGEGIDLTCGLSLDGCADPSIRLPTEAEWEYAARSGTTGPWPVARDQLDEIASFRGARFQSAVPADRLSATPWGLRQMHGSRTEWTVDRFGDYLGSTFEHPVATQGQGRVQRGGAAELDVLATRSAARAFVPDDALRQSVASWGVRCVEAQPPLSTTRVRPPSDGPYRRGGAPRRRR